ncbi:MULTISPECIES: hypothetical protein [Pseudothermotoga]|nr:MULTISPECIES: hypothetical protein [Pseudothermotoga]
MVIGLLLIAIVMVIAFSTISHQRFLIKRAFEMDLANRTAMNIFVRIVTNSEIPETSNGFQINVLSDKIILESSTKIYVYQIGDDDG